MQLAKVARQLGAHVTLISGPSSQRAPYEVDVIKIQVHKVCLNKY